MTTLRNHHNPDRMAVVAVSGLVLCAALAPVQSLIWNGAAAPGWVAALAGAWLPSLRDGTAASTLVEPPAPYFFYGRFVVLVYASLLAVVRARPLPSRFSRVLGVLLALAALGDFVAYWVSAVAGPGVRHVGFWNVEVPALAGALLVASVVGVRALRGATLPSHVAWCFALVAPAALVATAAVRYMPHGPLLPLAAAMVVHAFSSPMVHGAARPIRRGRRALAVLAVPVLALVALALMLLPYRPIVIAGVSPVPGPYALPPVVAELRLHVFNTGMNRMSALLVGSQRPWRPVPAFVIEHPTRGLVVFDCGLSEAVARDGEGAMPIPLRWLFESRGRPGRTLDDQMRAAGFDPAAVPLVVISHLHDDHVGVVSAFGAATFVAGAGTRRHFPELASRWREIAASDAAQPLPPFGGALDVFGDGSLTIIPGGGHAPEDLMLLVALPGGPVLLAGDAVVHRDWLAADDVQRIAADGARAAAVRNQIRAVLAAVPDLVLVPGHDLDGAPHGRADVVLHHPEWFGADAWPVTQ